MTHIIHQIADTEYECEKQYTRISRMKQIT